MISMPTVVSVNDAIALLAENVDSESSYHYMNSHLLNIEMHGRLEGHSGEF